MILQLSHLQHILEYESFRSNCKQCVSLFGGWTKPKCGNCKLYDGKYHLTVRCIHHKDEIDISIAMTQYRERRYILKPKALNRLNDRIAKLAIDRSSK